MTNVVDPKAYWDLPETIWWICKRDEQRVTDMQDMSEEDKIALALFGIRPMTVGLWSRSYGSLVWSSPQFLRADVMRAWPARNKKTAATAHAILRYLRQIMTPKTPLTKLEAQRRCMAEVHHAYPEAFKKAWAVLEPSCKRGRGKHGPRSH